MTERKNRAESKGPLEEGQRKTGIKIFNDKGNIKVSGSINLGYIGTFKTLRLSWMIHWKISENGIL